VVVRWDERETTEGEDWYDTVTGPFEVRPVSENAPFAPPLEVERSSSSEAMSTVARSGALEVAMTTPVRMLRLLVSSRLTSMRALEVTRSRCWSVSKVPVMGELEVLREMWEALAYCER
jgi:hypothetical protein